MRARESRVADVPMHRVELLHNANAAMQKMVRANLSEERLDETSRIGHLRQ